MYIELFIFDNFLMDALILRLASALASRRVRGARIALFALAGALAAWLALYFPWLLSLLGKLLIGAALALALPSESFSQYLGALGAVLFSAVALGGAALALASALGGGESAGMLIAPMPLRAALLTVALGVFLPCAVRRARSRRARTASLGTLVFSFGGKEYSIRDAILDTGSTLAEPLTGLPVVLVGIGELAAWADIPVPSESVAGERLLLALRPEAISLNGVPADALVAPVERLPSGGAVVPAQLFEPRREDT